MGKFDGEVDIVPKLFFNELCLKEGVGSYDVLKKLAESYSVLFSKNILPCRLSEDVRKSLDDYLKNIPGFSKKVISFMYSFFRSPYEEDDLSENDEASFVSKNYIYRSVSPVGLSWAAFFDGIALSLYNSEEWNCSYVDVLEDNVTKSVAHISRKEHLNDWIDSYQNVCLIKSPLSYDEKKKPHFRDDHGTDVLDAYWNKLKRCPYVEECVNSLPFNGKSSKFIRCIKSNFSIDLVLTWTDCGYGMNIKTTARNRREAEEIAKIIERDYGHPFV